jgi:transposase InsO family protein
MLQESQAMEGAVAAATRIRTPEVALAASICVYHRRLHSGLDYHTPEEYERLLA